MFSLSKKTALVTGGSRGIGAAIALRLAKAGARVVINYRSNQDAAEKVLAEVKKHSPDSLIKAFDISKSEEVNKSLAEVLEQVGTIDIAVCNAGVSRDALIPRSSPEQFQEVLDTNLIGTMNVIRCLSRPMMKNRYGRFVLMSSVIGEMGNKGQAAYAASKAALFGLSKSVSLELASRNITCNVVAPGFIETEMTGSLSDDVKAQYLSSIPLNRMASAEEVAAAVHFLVSEEASYITGSTLDINGGLLMR